MSTALSNLSFQCVRVNVQHLMGAMECHVFFPFFHLFGFYFFEHWISMEQPFLVILTKKFAVLQKY